MKSCSSREVIKILKADGWYEVNCTGGHHQFKHPMKKGRVTLTHPKKDIPSLGSLPDDFDFEFDPVAEPSDKERADLAKCGTDNVVAAYNAGLISQRTALKELKQQSERTGVWTNITDEDIERASDTVEPPGEMSGMFGGMGGEYP